MTIEVMYFAGCPNTVLTLERVRQVLGDFSVEADIVEVEVRSPEHARELGFLGSPSVRLDGLDIEPEARGSTAYAFGCRTYLDSGTRSGVPSLEMLQRALDDSGPGPHLDNIKHYLKV